MLVAWEVDYLHGNALRTSLQNPNDLDTIVTCRSQLPQRTVRLAVGVFITVNFRVGMQA